MKAPSRPGNEETERGVEETFGEGEGEGERKRTRLRVAEGGKETCLTAEVKTGETETEERETEAAVDTALTATGFGECCLDVA